MEPLFDDDVILNRFLHWLNLGPERDDLQMCSALSLGNLARSGEYNFQIFDFKNFFLNLHLFMLQIHIVHNWFMNSRLVSHLQMF